MYNLGPNGEPKVTHGNTLVSDLSLEEVAKIIDVSKILILLLSTISYCHLFVRNMLSKHRYILLSFHWRTTAVKLSRYSICHWCTCVAV